MTVACEKCAARIPLADSGALVEGLVLRCPECEHVFPFELEHLESASDREVAEGLAFEAATLRRPSEGTALAEGEARIESNLAENLEAHRFGTTDASLEPTLERVGNWARFLGRTRSEPEWLRFLAAEWPSNRAAYGLFTDSFRRGLPGSRVLEFGAGRGAISAAMALMGAEVVAVDISPSTPEIVGRTARGLGLQGRLEGHSGDIRKFARELGRFDCVVGMNVLHHLIPELEAEIVDLFARMLEPGGRCVFVEPCENWALLQELKERVKPEQGAHPERPNDSGHFQQLGERHFRSVEVVPYGSLERWVALLRGGQRNGPLRARLLAAERFLPGPIHTRLAASQRIEFREPFF